MCGCGAALDWKLLLVVVRIRCGVFDCKVVPDVGSFGDRLFWSYGIQFVFGRGRVLVAVNIIRDCQGL